MLRLAQRFHAQRKKSPRHPDDLRPQRQSTLAALVVECHHDVLQERLATVVAGPPFEDEQTASTETQRQVRAVV